MTIKRHDGFPFGNTARRRTWDQLPAHVRGRIAVYCEADIVDATSTTSGFTPGFASVLTLSNGRRAFVKAAGRVDDEKHGWEITGSYREEVRKRSALPDDLPAPRVLWSADDGDWILIGFEYVPGRPPRRPWDVAELDCVLATLTDMAPMLDPAPAELELPPAWTFFEPIDEGIDEVRRRDGWSPELATIAELARELPDRAGGTAMAQFDVRDDNIILTPDGRALICDWNWPRIGAPWLDLVGLLLSVHGDGLDADAVVSANPLTRDVEPRSIDSFLAALWLLFTTRCDEPAVGSSPYLREFQRLEARWTLSWLRARRRTGT